LNMREYPRYSAISITECETVNDNTSHPDHGACRLATARNKKALVRVGGGERFQDVASAIWALKDETTSFAKYNILNGVGTVGAAGGWLQVVVSVGARNDSGESEWIRCWNWNSS